MAHAFSNPRKRGRSAWHGALRSSISARSSSGANPYSASLFASNTLERAVVAQARRERQILDAVTAARANGISWQRVGEILGTSAQAAHQRYGAVIESA